MSPAEKFGCGAERRKETPVAANNGLEIFGQLRIAENRSLSSSLGFGRIPKNAVRKILRVGFEQIDVSIEVKLTCRRRNRAKVGPDTHRRVVA